MEIIDHVNAALAHLDAARTLEADTLSGAELAHLMRSAQAAMRTTQALILEVTAAADSKNVARREGAASTQAWMAQTSGITHREAARDLKLAHDLRTVAPQTRQAMSQPGMSTPKARLIAGAMSKLPTGLDDNQRGLVEADLVDKAQKHSVDDLRRAVKRAVDVIDPTWADTLESATLAGEEQTAYRTAEFWMGATNDDGMVEGGFTLPVLEADILRSVLESHTSPRHDCTNQPDEGQPDESSLTEERPTYLRKLGRAFTDIIAHLPRDCYGNHGGVAATLMVTVSHDTLTAQIERAGTDSLGNRISPDTIRQLACTVGIIPAVLAGDGKILDVGRQKRLFTPAQRLALAHRDGGCAFPGCDKPPGWTEAHHITYWQDHGSTDLKDGVLLCARHHRIIHHTDWTVQAGPTGHPEFIPPAHVDPQQRPRYPNRWQPAISARQ